MSLAIKFGDTNDPFSLAGALYFDAVTAFDRDYSGRVTEHPLEAGAMITDHFVSNNAKYKIAGVFSGVDFSNIPSTVTIDGQPLMNANPAPSAVQVQDGNNSLLRTFTPAVLEQFFGQMMPTVTMDQSPRLNFSSMIEDFLREILTGLYYNSKREKWENRITPAVLYEMEGATPVRPVQDLVLTSVNISEDQDSGDALILTMTLEKVNYVTSEKAEAPKAEGKTGRQVEETKNKGNKPAPTNDPKNPPNEPNTVIGEINKGKNL